MAKKRGNGEGSIYYSEKLGRYVAQVSLGYKDDGSPKRKSLYAKTRKEVVQKMDELKRKYDDGKLVDKSSYTLVQVIEKIIEEQYAANIFSATTYKRKKETLNTIANLSIGNMEIQQIDVKDINQALASLIDTSNSCITKVSQMIKLAYERAIQMNIINYSPFDRKGLIIVPRSTRVDKKVDALTIEEQQLLIGELKKNYDIYTDELTMALYTGMRIGEILALNKDDIDLNNKLINISRTLTRDENDKVIIGKTTKTYAGTRIIPITPLIYDLIEKRYKSTDDLLFTKNDKLIDPSTINIHFKKICKNANIRVKVTKKKKHKEDLTSVNLKSAEVNTHMLRHTYATRCIESGMAAPVLSKLLGHTDIQTTLNTYTSVFNRFKDNEINKYLEYISQLH